MRITPKRDAQLASKPLTGNVSFVPPRKSDIPKPQPVDVGGDLGELSPKEVEFLKQAKAQGMEMNQAADFLKQKRQEESRTGDLVKNIAVGVGTLVPSAFIGGKLLKSIGKGIYGLTLPPDIQTAGQMQAYKAGVSNVKPRTMVDSAIESPLLQKGSLRSPSSFIGQMGSRSQLGVQGLAKGTNLFKKKIAPLFKIADDQGIKVPYHFLKNKAIDAINASKKFSIEQKTEIIDDIKGIMERFKGKTSLQNLDLVKRELANKLPAKYYQGAPMTQTLKDAQGILSSIFRETVHNTLKDKFGVNSAKIYNDYANFVHGLAEVGKKSMTQSAFKGGFGQLVSGIKDEIATPITTTVGKLTFKLGQALEAPGSVAIKAAKAGIKGLKNIIKAADPAAVIMPDMLKAFDEVKQKDVKDVQEAITLLQKGQEIPMRLTIPFIAARAIKDKEKLLKLLQDSLSE